MRRVLVATLVVLPLALLAAGCGGDAIALDPVAQAAKKTQQQSSQQIEFTFSSAAGSGQGTGVFDKSGAGKVDFTFTGGGRTFTLNEISTSKLVIYLRSELFQRELPDGKSWLRVDLQREAKKLGLDLGSLSDANPSGGLQHCATRAPTITRLGGPVDVQAPPDDQVLYAGDLR